MKIRFISKLEKDKSTTVVVMTTQNTISKLEIISPATLNMYDFKFDKEGIIEFKNTAGYKKVIIANMGVDEKITENCLRNMGGKIADVAKAEKDLQIDTLAIIGKDAVANVVLGIKLKSYNFDKYISDEEDKKAYKIENIAFMSSNQDLKEVDAVYQGVELARNLVSEPANVLYPRSYVDILKKVLHPKIELEILGQKELENEKMGALLSVSAGGDKEPFVVVMKYNGGKEGDAPLAFIGKGVTFDTGGYSLKPPAGMIGMKKDMGGSAAVVGLMQTLAHRGAKVNVIGAIGLTENTVSGTATKPGDIVTSRMGKTIEVLNTDAEGRMVLADVLHYVGTTYNPKFMINLATLTGAIIVCLGSERAGLFSNNEELIEKIETSSKNSGELVWNMPVSQEYAKYLKSSCADLQNISLQSSPGSIYAAMFLKEFVNDIPWAHLDIAGTADTSKGLPICQKGATGWGVRLLNDLIKNNYEA